MDFREFLEAFNNSTYQVPDDKEHQLYDFYMLAYLKPRSSWDKKIKSVATNQGYNLTAPDVSYRGEMDENDKVSYRLQEIANTLLPSLKTSLLEAVLFSISAEIRHVFDSGSNSKEVIEPSLSPSEYQAFKKYAKNFLASNSKNSFFQDRFDNKHKDIGELEYSARDYKNAYRAYLASDIPAVQFVTMAQKLFSLAFWSYGFGGKAWEKIAAGWLRLYGAKKESDLFVAIDHLYDLQHNTDTVFNKVNSYLKNSSFGWIAEALNHKATIKNPFEIFDKISPSFRAIAARAIKAKTGNSLEDYYKERDISAAKDIKEIEQEVEYFMKATPKYYSISNAAADPKVGLARAIIAMSNYIIQESNVDVKRLGMAKIKDIVQKKMLSMWKIPDSAVSVYAEDEYIKKIAYNSLAMEHFLDTFKPEIRDQILKLVAEKPSISWSGNTIRNYLKNATGYPTDVLEKIAVWLSNNARRILINYGQPINVRSGTATSGDPFSKGTSNYPEDPFKEDPF